MLYAGTDPAAVGLVESLRKPGGRLTGIHGQFTNLTAKRLELLKQMIPRLRRVITFHSPDNPAAQRSLKIARDAARHLKVELIARPVASVEELRAGLRALQPGVNMTLQRSLRVPRSQDTMYRHAAWGASFPEGRGPVS